MISADLDDRMVQLLAEEVISLELISNIRNIRWRYGISLLVNILFNINIIEGHLFNIINIILIPVLYNRRPSIQ